ncbi:MAG: hypothetical protein A3D65_01490 [Candidatus Lloydbacteria bacterium RIFCSPHIGHO2_02_FULL_50_13]|uniref:Uncharacterized protein n=1 Tax=Candidatus Lloydbacteria bacterium RIFCSPHIGHO2_02_FULL_50_13 TaxID=1798661 RepID=A0A1G2D4R9_9BACT|nr:MAG: hypothetical protein A3D65_01490 [Candidatus Lloydbacteria bacterium RIFCSPHIGHO2_02_FULL_50_13]
MRTHITFFCRGEKVAIALVEGSVAQCAGEHLVNFWSVVEVSGRREYWRNDPEESQAWDIHEIGGYTAFRSGSDEEEQYFDDALRRDILEIGGHASSRK